MLNKSNPPTKWKRLGAHFQARFTAGVLIIIPVLVTYIVIGWIVGFIVDTLEPVIDQAEGHLASWMTGILFNSFAVIIAIGLMYAVGALGATVLGGRFVRVWHAALERIPVIRAVYRTARQTTDFFSGGAELQRSQVVMVEYPRLGVHTMGLVTGSYIDDQGDTFLAVYIPTVPLPTSGLLAYFRESDVIRTSMTFEDAMRIVFSAGVLTRDKPKG